MKSKNLKRLVFLTGKVLITALFVCSTANAKDFAIKKNGGVEVDGNTFSSMQKYVQSDYFKKSGKRCGARVKGNGADPRLEKSVADCTTALTNIQNEYFPSVVYKVPVWFHVIYRSDGTGNIPTADINGQMEALNEDYRATAGSMGSNGFDVKIVFELAGITRTQNDDWFTDSDADESAYKQALAKDPNKNVNIYTNDAQGLLGYAYFPQGGSAGSWWDGIVLAYASVGGRDNSFIPYNHGRTLVHEMGHYLGLFHTFQGGNACSNTYSSGDLIVDTNAESEPHYGCAPASTCGNSDPINNYMDYSDDECMYKFTREQANRAVCSLVNYRPNIFEAQGGGGGGGEEDEATVPPLLMPLILNK